MDDSTLGENNHIPELLRQPEALEQTTKATSHRVTDAQLEDQITTLCATMAAMEYQFLCLLAEFDTRRTWAGVGTYSCAHWLNWRCGLNLGAARERVRVAHALENLPKISEAFSKGHLSYSKVRAMTRIATPELEDDLMVTAQYGSASHIEKLVRLYRHVDSPEKLETERKASNERHFNRSITHYWNDEGCLIIKARLPPEQGALVLKALEAAEESLKKDDQFNPWQEVSEESNKTKINHPVSPECVNHVSAETPSKQEAKQSGERQLARRVDGLVLMARDWLIQDHQACKNADRYQVVVNIDADILANKIRPDNSEQLSSIDDMQALPVDTVRRISCDCGVTGVITDNQQPLSISRKTRSIPPAIRRALVRRDHGCTWPGCAATRYVEGHHIQHWANGGETSLENLTLLCSNHHQLLHEGDYTVTRNTEGRLDFFDPRGRYMDPGQAQPDDIEYRHHVHALQKHGIDETTIWSYCGDRMDYDQAVDGLISARDKARKRCRDVVG